MGKRGPLPKNHALKVLSGTVPMTKELIQEINAPFDFPTAPEHFNTRERRAWVDTINLLKPLKLLSRVDVAIMGAYCCAFVRWQDAEKEIQNMQSIKTGLCTTTKTGKIIGINPLITISRAAQQDMVAYAVQLGMSPSARLKMVVSVGKIIEDNPFSKLKSGDNGK